MSSRSGNTGSRRHGRSAAPHSGRHSSGQAVDSQSGIIVAPEQGSNYGWTKKSGLAIFTKAYYTVRDRQTYATVEVLDASTVLAADVLRRYPNARYSISHDAWVDVADQTQIPSRWVAQNISWDKWEKTWREEYMVWTGRRSS